MKILFPPELYLTRRFELVSIFTLCMCLSLHGQVQAAPTPAVRESSAFSIDGKQYRLKELTGFSQQELRAQFDAEVAKMTDETLKNALRNRGPAFPVRATMTREALEKELWKYAISNLLDTLVGDLVLASICDRIVKQHEIKLDEYFDLAALRDGMQRQFAYLDFIHARQHEPPGKEDEWHAEAIKKFRFKMTREYWTATGEEFRRRPAFLKWPLEAMRRAADNDDYLLKAMLAHYLLREACETGIYHEKARQVFHAKSPPPQLLEITGFYGSRQSLEQVVAHLVDAKGELKHSAATTLIRWLRDLAPGASAQLTMAMENGTPSMDVPVPGTLYEVVPGTFRIYGRLPGAPQAGAAPEQDKGLALFYKVYAYKIAASQFLPDVEPRISEWKPDVVRLSDSISSPGTSRMPEVAFDPFIKKPYPETVFADFERHRSTLQELAVSAARLSIGQDQKGALALVESIAGKSQAVQTAPVRKAYQAISQRLSANLAGTTGTPAP